MFMGTAMALAEGDPWRAEGAKEASVTGRACATGTDAVTGTARATGTPGGTGMAWATGMAWTVGFSAWGAGTAFFTGKGGGI